MPITNECNFTHVNALLLATHVVSVRAYTTATPADPMQYTDGKEQQHQQQQQTNECMQCCKGYNQVALMSSMAVWR